MAIVYGALHIASYTQISLLLVSLSLIFLPGKGNLIPSPSVISTLEWILQSPCNACAMPAYHFCYTQGVC